MERLSRMAELTNVETAAGNLAEAIVVRCHMFAKVVWQVEFKETLQAVVYFEEVFAVRIWRDPIRIGFLFFYRGWEILNDG